MMPTSATTPGSQRANLRVLMYLYFPGGGIGRYTARLMPELSAEGATVEAVVVPEFIWRDTPGYDVWPHLRSISHPNPLRRKARFLVGQFINPRRLARRSREFEADVVHICNINHLSYPTWEKQFPITGPKIAVSVHDVERQKGIICKPWEAWQLRRFYRRADILFVHSESQASALVDFAAVDRKKVEVVPHGPYEYAVPTESREETRRRLGIPEGVRLGLAFGLIRDEKNIDRLIDALANQPDDSHLLIAGSDVSGHKASEYYVRLSEHLGISDRVHVCSGFVPDADVSNLFQASDWAALTYSMNFSSQSGVLSSAVQFEVPILATPTATFAECLGKYSIGVLCKDDSVSAITDGVRELRSSKASFDFGAYRRENSWHANAAITLSAYEGALA